MKKLFISLALLTITVFYPALNAIAASIGLSGSYSVMRGEVTYNAANSAKEQYDAVISRMAFGIFVNAELDNTKLFSYRLNGSVYIFNNESSYQEDADTKIIFKGAGVDIVNTLGFNIIRSKYFVFWMGPTLGLGYGITDKIRHQSEATNYSDKGTYEEYFIYAAGSIGASFKLYESIGVEVSGGYRAMPLSSRFKMDSAKENDKIDGVLYGPYIECAISLFIE